MLRAHFMNRPEENELSFYMPQSVLLNYKMVTDAEIENRALWHSVNKSAIPTQVVSPSMSITQTPNNTPVLRSTR